MNESPPIETEVVSPQERPAQPTQAVALRQSAGPLSTERLSLEELRANLSYIHEVMQSVMKEGQDYGKVPGCGDKPSLLQPGAQKLCMTFRLQDRVKEEKVIDLPNYHREYRFIVSLVSLTGCEWDGVGTCSTLEAKYRYRSSGRRCPKCGKETIRKSKQGEGWYCWAKIGGCGANFPGNLEAITSQKETKVEHDNPADFWNTVRKMAFKRALVHAAINATNTSELWTQDVEDMDFGRGDNAPPEPPNSPPEPPPRRPATEPAPPASPGEKGCPQPQPAPGTELPVPYPTAESRKKMIDALKANPGQDNRNIVHEYFRKLTNPTPLMANEEIEKLELRFVPATTKQMKKLAECVRNFESGLPAEHAFPMHFDPQAPTPGVTTPAQVAPKIVAEATKKPADPLWWRNVIVSKPRKGMKKAEYERHPDTLGALYDLRHGNDEEAQAARQRLWGLAEHAPEPRQFNGRTYQPTEADWTTYRAAQAFKEWFAANHPDEKL